MITDGELGWLAGIIDGEGSVRLYRKPRGISHVVVLSVRVTNTMPAIIDSTVRIMRGLIDNPNDVHVYQLTPSNRKICWSVEITKRSAVLSVLTAVLPYLFGKRIEAELLIEWCRERLKVRPGKGGGGLLSKEEHAYVNRFFAAIEERDI
jgi:hypothetical protein